MINNMTSNQRTRPVIVHGHFYQPPRENPWLEVIQRQPSARPFHDWNERIYHECYRPNAFARVLDGQGRIQDIINNYQYLSFNFGPTLFYWLEREHPHVARLIIEADAESYHRLGHGNALAQVYNHIIMPLASPRDQRTQVRWSQQFFRERFGRDPEGLWLAETAINRTTVEVLIEEGIRFVVLSPQQGAAIRKIGEPEWQPRPGGSVPLGQVYRVFSHSDPNGFLDILFFDEGLSRAISFERILESSYELARRLKEAPGGDDVALIATDGETFGHHKSFGDMCLASFFRNEAEAQGLRLVNCGWYVDNSPAEYEVRLTNEDGEGSAWSCAHGIGRWSRDCGCSTGGPPEWRQTWRAPLRTAFDDLQKSVDTEFERVCVTYHLDSWKLRDDAGWLWDHPGINNLKLLLEQHHAAISLGDEDLRRLLRLLQAQRFMLYSYTSCAWFFTDVTGIETIQNLLYAGRALQLALPPSEHDAAIHKLLSSLSHAKSNLPPQTGETLFVDHVQPRLRHLARIAFTSVVQRLIATNEENLPVFGWSVNFELPSERSPRFSIPVVVANDITGETGSFNLDITNDGGLDIRAEVTRTDVDHDVEHEACSLGIGDCFGEWLDHLDELYVRAYTTDITEYYASHRQILRRLIDILRRLGLPAVGGLEHILAGSIAFEWNNTLELVQREGVITQSADSLRKFATIAEELDINLDKRQAAKVLLKVANRLLDSIIDQNAKSDELVRLIDLTDELRIPLFVAVLEERVLQWVRTHPEHEAEELTSRLNLSPNSL